jgi:WD40 repeat protein
LYDFKSDKISHTFRHDDFVTRAIFSTGEDTVISCARNVFLWNKKTGDLIKKLTSCGETFKNTICLSHSGNILAVAGLDKIYLVDVFHDSLIGTLNYLYPVENITFSENDLFLISSSEENSITFWDVHEMKELLTTYFFEKQEMELIHISPEGLFDCKPELFNKLVYPNHLEVDPNLLINNKFYTPGLWKKMIKY